MDDSLTYDFEPSCCHDQVAEDRTVKARFKGSIKVRLLEFDERWTKNGKVSSLKQEGKIAECVIESIKCTSECFLEVNLEHLKTGRLYKSVEDLKRDPRCDIILIECAKGLLQGFDEGND